jgi:hypothetical protein
MEYTRQNFSREEMKWNKNVTQVKRSTSKGVHLYSTSSYDCRREGTELVGVGGTQMNSPRICSQQAMHARISQI